MSEIMERSIEVNKYQEDHIENRLKDCWGHLDTKLIKNRDCVNCLHGIMECSVESSKKEKKNIERKWCKLEKLQSDRIAKQNLMVVDEFKEYLKGNNLSERSIYKYGREIIRFLGRMNLLHSDVNLENTANYLDWLAERGYARLRLNQFIVSIRHFGNFKNLSFGEYLNLGSFGLGKRTRKGLKEPLSIENQEILKKYDLWMRSAKFSKKSIVTYSSWIRVTLGHIGVPFSEIKIADLLKFQEYISVERNFAKASVVFWISVMKSFFYDCLDMLEEKELKRKLKAPPRDRKRLKVCLNKDEVGRLRSVLKLLDYDVYVAVSFGLYTGLRLSELLKITPGNITCFPDTYVHVVQGKGDKDRLVGFASKNNEILDLLLEYIEKRGLDLNDLTTPIFNFGIQRFKGKLSNAIIQAGIDKNVTPHTLRGTFITNTYKRTKDIVYCQKLAGHVSIETTRSYIAMEDDEVFEINRSHMLDY